MKKRRFRHGQAFTDIMRALDHIEAGGDVYFNHKWLSNKWIVNWSVARIRNAVAAGALFKTEDVTDDRWQKERYKAEVTA